MTKLRILHFSADYFQFLQCIKPADYLSNEDCYVQCFTQTPYAGKTRHIKGMWLYNRRRILDILQLLTDTLGHFVLSAYSVTSSGCSLKLLLALIVAWILLTKESSHGSPGSVPLLQE